MHVRTSSFAIAACGIFAVLLASPAALAEQPKPEQEITKDNWEHDPAILGGRKLYNDIQSRLEGRKLKLRKKDFSKLPRSCRGMYPLEYLTVATDRAGRVRMFIEAQRISHDDLLTTRYYYDEGGLLRFIYKTNESPGFATIENRSYLNEQGKVFWDVKKEAKKLTFGEVTRDPSEIDEVTNKYILENFERTKVECEPEEDAQGAGKAAR